MAIVSTSPRLERHIQANHFESRTHLHPVALSNVSGEAEIHHGSTTWTNQGDASLVSTNDRNLERKCMVETARLDDFVERHRIERIDFIKVDIEGAEPLFLNGAENILKSMKPILCVEVSVRGLSSLPNYGPRDLVRTLEEFGYDLFEVATNGNRGRQIDHRSIPADYNAENICAGPKASAA